MAAIDDPAALETIYDREADETPLTPGGQKFVLSRQFTKEEFTQIRSQITVDGAAVTNPDYTNYVMPARQACAWDATAKKPGDAGVFHRSAVGDPGVHGGVPLPGSGADAGCDLKASALQGQCRHQPHGLRRRDSGAGAGHGVRHLCRPQLP